MPSTKNSRPEDTKQAVRMRRYYIAAFTSLLVLFLIFACSWLGFLDSKILVIGGLLILFFTALFLFTISNPVESQVQRSKLNRTANAGVEPDHGLRDA